LKIAHGSSFKDARKALNLQLRREKATRERIIYGRNIRKAKSNRRGGNKESPNAVPEGGHDGGSPGEGA